MSEDFSDKEFLEKLDIDQVKQRLKSIEVRQLQDVKTFFDEFKKLLPDKSSIKKQYKELYKDMKGIIRLYRREQTEIIRTLLALEIFKEPFKEMNWDEIKKRFKKEKDLEEKMKMLLSITNQRKVCKDTACRIYPAISKAQSSLTDLKYTTLESAKENLGYTDFNHFEENYYELRVLLDLILIEIFKLSSVHDTVRSNTAIRNVEWRKNIYIADKARKDKKGLISNLGGGPEDYLQKTDPNRDPIGNENAFTEEGKHNDEALKDLFKKDLDGLRKKKKERIS